MLEMCSDEYDAYAKLNVRASEGKLRFAFAHGTKQIDPDAADVIAVSLPGDMSGTGAMLLVKVAERGLFTRAEDLTLNGLHGFIGPAPNERLGVVDVLVTGGMVSDDGSYTGMEFFEDLLNDREIALNCLSLEHSRYEAKTHLSIMKYARMTIYDMPIDPVLAKLGEDSLFAGTSLFLNGGRSVMLGSGSYGTADEPTLSCACDCFVMDKSLMLPKETGQAARHTVTMLFPVWRNSPASELCSRIAALVGEHSEAEAGVLLQCEQRMADAVAAGMKFVDPGPKPYRTIFTS